MDNEQRWKYILQLDDELLAGGVMLSESCVFLIRETDIAFVNGAYLATVITSMAAVETYLRSEYSETGAERLFELIENSALESQLKSDLQELRKYRNAWVHVHDPWDTELLAKAEDESQHEFKQAACLAMRCLRSVIYDNQWI